MVPGEERRRMGTGLLGNGADVGKPEKACNLEGGFWLFALGLCLKPAFTLHA
jgi:hypothetical protein